MLIVAPMRKDDGKGGAWTVVPHRQMARKQRRYEARLEAYERLDTIRPILFQAAGFQTPAWEWTKETGQVVYLERYQREGQQPTDLLASFNLGSSRVHVCETRPLPARIDSVLDPDSLNCCFEDIPSTL